MTDSSRDPFEKLPPSDPAAERAALCAMLVEPAILPEVRRIIATPLAFHLAEHQLIFTALCAVVDRGERLDLVTLASELRARQQFDDIGGVETLAGLAQACPVPSHGPAYARAVVKAYQRRSLLKLGFDLSDAAHAPDAGDRIARLLEVSGRRLAQIGQAGADTAGEARPGPVLIRLADVRSRTVPWLWPGRIPLGRITLLVGMPGIGKSFLTADMAARVSTGAPWPDGSACPRGSVILISAEDDPGDTIRPRLDAAQADTTQIHLLSMVRRLGDDGRPRQVMFDLANVAALESALQTMPDCRLLVIDPVGSFIGGGVDAHRDNEVRSVLAPVAALAEKYGSAVLIVAHRRKSGGTVADDLAMGSRAFTGIARAAWHLTRDPQNRARRLLLAGKNNLASEGNGLAFVIMGDPPALAWEDEPVDMCADDALAMENGDGRPNSGCPGPEPLARDEAADWLRTLLANGEQPAATIEDRAALEGFNLRTVRRAATALKAIRERNPFTQVWQWRLPKTT